MQTLNEKPCRCDDPLLNIKALANYLNISVSAATKLSAKRLIPVLKPSKKVVLYRKSDIDHWLNLNRIERKPTTEELADSLLTNSKSQTYES